MGKKVLSGLCICASATLSVPRKKFQSLVEDNGAEFASSITKKVTHLVCDQDEYDNVSSKVAKAREFKLPIVKEGFVTDSISKCETITFFKQLLLTTVFTHRGL